MSINDYRDKHQITSILRQRAQRLSRKQIVSISSEKELEVLDFSLCGENYCIETSYVVEVHRDYKIVEIPSATPFLLGIVNRRGSITPIVDMKILLNLTTQTSSDKHFLIVVSEGQKEFGFLVDSILGVRQITESSISTQMPTLSTLPKNYVFGISDDNSIVLNIKNILNDSRLVVDEKVV